MPLHSLGQLKQHDVRSQVALQGDALEGTVRQAAWGCIEGGSQACITIFTPRLHTPAVPPPAAPGCQACPFLPTSTPPPLFTPCPHLQ